MRDLFRLIGWAVVDLLRSRAALEAEIWTLRQQINVLRRTAPRKLSFSVLDRLVFVGLYRLFPKICDALAIAKPDTIVGWHRADFRLYWGWKSRRRSGRPKVPLEKQDGRACERRSNNDQVRDASFPRRLAFHGVVRMEHLAKDEFLLAATAQSLRKLAKLVNPTTAQRLASA